jgi:predicted amidohydrolase
MSRPLMLAAAQLGPIGRREPRASVIARMLTLIEDAAAIGCELVVFPEMALTTFFPRWHIDDEAEVASFFDRQMPGPETQALFDASRRLGVGFYLGYCEETAKGTRHNASILVEDGEIVGRYRKVHLPGNPAYDPELMLQHLEPWYFEDGDLGFPVFQAFGALTGMLICNDRRWPEAYREMGLQGVELVMLGYNTPSTNSQQPGEALERRLFHSDLSMQAGAYQNATWVVGVAKAGVEDGHPMFGGSVIVDPSGIVVQRAETEGDELLVHACDMDDCNFGKATIFDFKRHRRIEHYKRITAQTGVIRPDGTAG